MKRSFRNYGLFDVTKFKKIITESNLDWDEFDFRQKTFDVHKETKTIPIIFDDKLDIEKAEKTKHYVLFEKELFSLQEHLRTIIDEPQGYIYRAILAKLPIGKSIKPHLDKGVIFEPRRIHIVIQTNKSCYFTVADITKNLKEGEIWEVNNNGNIHSVSNEGETDRIHLIIDWKN